MFPTGRLGLGDRVRGRHSTTMAQWREAAQMRWHSQPQRGKASFCSHSVCRKFCSGKLPVLRSDQMKVFFPVAYTEVLKKFATCSHESCFEEYLALLQADADGQIYACQFMPSNLGAGLGSPSGYQVGDGAASAAAGQADCGGGGGGDGGGSAARQAESNARGTPMRMDAEGSNTGRGDDGSGRGGVGGLLLTASEDTVNLWNVETQQRTRLWRFQKVGSNSLGGPRNPDDVVFVFDAKAHAAGDIIAVALSDGTVRTVDPRVAVPVGSLTAVGASHMAGVAWSDDGALLAACGAGGGGSGGRGGAVHCWDFRAAGRPAAVYWGHEGPVYGCCFLPQPLPATRDGEAAAPPGLQLLLSWAGDGTVRCWRSDDVTTDGSCGLGCVGIRGASACGDGTGATPASGEVTEPAVIVELRGEPIYHCAFRADRGWLALASAGKHGAILGVPIRLYDIASFAAAP
ncbi:unnamed protein product [Phaeothamnion confervicola]